MAPQGLIPQGNSLGLNQTEEEDTKPDKAAAPWFPNSYVLSVQRQDQKKSHICTRIKGEEVKRPPDGQT